MNYNIAPLDEKFIYWADLNSKKIKRLKTNCDKGIDKASRLWYNFKASGCLAYQYIETHGSVY